MRHIRTAMVMLACATVALVACAKASDETMPLPLLDGNTAYLTDFDGQVIVLYFWASWCPPCKTTMPILQELNNEYAEQGLVVLGVNERETASQAQAYTEEVNVTFPIVLDKSADIANYYRLMGPPATILLGNDGEVVKQFIGVVSRDQLDEFLVPLFIDGEE